MLFRSAESIHIIREVAAEFENPVMLYSIGKDSAVMVRLAEKAFFPAKPLGCDGDGGACVTDDEALALGAVDASVREGLLGIPGAALVCDESKLTLVTSLAERNVDAELVDQVRAVVAGLCAPFEGDTPGL